MRQKYYLNAFAVAGDITPDIPDPTDVSGFVSYNQGFTFDYQRDLTTDTLAKSILRININAIMNDATTNIQDYQRTGSPEFITSSQNGGSAFPYRLGSIVRYSTSGVEPFHTFISITDNNTATPVPGSDGVWIDLTLPRVQQGGGTGQGTNHVYIGWDGSAGSLRAQVDATDLGEIAQRNWVTANFGGLGSANTWTAANTFSDPVNIAAATSGGQAASLAQAEGTLSTSANGFQIFPSGLICVWGHVTLPASGTQNSSATATFAHAFPNACFGLTGTAQGTANSVNGFPPIIATSGAPGLSTAVIVGDILGGNSGAVVFNQTVPVFYMAWGW